jgi:pimeloyl-ACP methyl ester carboxylesterase
MRRLATIFSGLLLAAALVSRPAMIERLVFFPDRIVGDPPPGVQERWIRTADGIRLHAWQATHPQAHTSVVWSHGNGGNIAYRASIIVALAAHGLDVLAYDYRGYGKSEGRPTEAGVY